MNEDKVIQKLIQHDESLNVIEEKINDLPTRQEFLQKQDEMMVILKRLDEERVFTVEWIRRIEKEVEDHSSQIKRVKEQLKIA